MHPERRSVSVAQALELPRCALRSLALDEPLLGTASTARSWLLLEQPGPWGRNALLDSRLPDGLGPGLDALRRRLGIKVLLVRRTGRGATSTHPHCFLVRTDPDSAWIEQVRLPTAEAVLDLDLAALAAGTSPGLERRTNPMFLVCTHGRHDACCAERGRPVAAALSACYPEETWEASHVGGDRFAANVLAFPHGLYFGRLGPDEAVDVADDYLAGELHLRHFRGRATLPFAVQAAEVFLRGDQGITGVDDLRVLEVTGRGPEVRVRFADTGGRAFLVRVRTGAADPPRRLSCHDAAVNRPPTYELVEIGKD